MIRESKSPSIDHCAFMDRLNSNLSNVKRDSCSISSSVEEDGNNLSFCIDRFGEDFSRRNVNVEPNQYLDLMETEQNNSLSDRCLASEV